MTSNNGDLKERIYRSLCQHGVAVFTDDVANPSELALCGVRLSATGLELLKILFELAQEGKMVIWQEDGTYGFLPTRRWRKEISAVNAPLRSECEAMKLESKDIADLKDSIIEIIAGTLVSSRSRCSKGSGGRGSSLISPALKLNIPRSI